MLIHKDWSSRNPIFTLRNYPLYVPVGSVPDGDVAMDLSDVVGRISEKITSKGKSVDRKKIEAKLQRLIEEFGVHISEAERTVMNELAREYSIITLSSRTAEQKEIGLLIPGEWVTVEGKVVTILTPPTPAMAQTGIIADSTGAIRYVVWSKANAPQLEQGKWYHIESAVVDEFRRAPKLNIHSGTTIKPAELDTPIMPTMSKILELRPGVGSLRAKVIQDWEPSHPRMLQTGLLGDESGTIRFTIWNDGNKEKLTVNAVYSIYYAQIDEFNGRLQLNLTGSICMPEEGNIEVGVSETMMGVLVHVAPGSGLIKRCPIDGCNRVLSRQNYCPIHEVQTNFRYDLRIKGVLDDGSRTFNVLLLKDLVEKLAGMSLEAAIELAENNPLGMDEVFFRIRDVVVGRYFTCTGSEMEDRILVRDCKKIPYDTKQLATLLNRAGGVPP